MELLRFLIVGVIAGWIAGKLRRNRGYGLLGNVVVGVLGAVVGGSLFRLLGITAGGWIAQVVVAALGALVLLWVLSAVQK